MSRHSPDSGVVWLLWIPSLAGIVSLLMVWANRHSSGVELPFFVSIFVAAYLLILSIVWGILRSGPEVSQAVGMTTIIGGGLITVIVFSISENLFGPATDNFADGLSLPEGIELNEPVTFEATAANKGEFSAALMSALQRPANGKAEFTADIPNFVSLAEGHPDRLLDYLIKSPSWRVFKERGAKYATRRWQVGGTWRYPIHGFYTDEWVADAPARFKTRFTICLDGRPWTGNLGGATRVPTGQSRSLGNVKSDGLYLSHCEVKAGALTIECFEQSPEKERRLTKASFQQFETELKEMVNPTSALPGQVQFQLSGEKGLYETQIWINPGEPGMIYLKAFEITSGKALSARRLKEKSNEWVGWSEAEAQKYFSQTHFTIQEGNWGQFYGARFELWFVPDSGAEERKLLEKDYKIEGWMR